MYQFKNKVTVERDNGETEEMELPNCFILYYNDKMTGNYVFSNLIENKHEVFLPAKWRIVPSSDPSFVAVVNDNGTEAIFFKNGEKVFSHSRTDYYTFKDAPFTKNGYADYLLIFGPNDQFLIHGKHSEILHYSKDFVLLDTYYCREPEFFCSYQTTSDLKYLVLRGWIWQPFVAQTIIDLTSVWNSSEKSEKTFDEIFGYTDLDHDDVNGEKIYIEIKDDKFFFTDVPDFPNGFVSIEDL
jgi:hypothetical protein